MNPLWSPQISRFVLDSFVGHCGYSNPKFDLTFKNFFTEFSSLVAVCKGSTQPTLGLFRLQSSEL